MEHEDLVDELLEAENKADLQARAAYMVGNIKKSRHYAGLRVKAQEDRTMKALIWNYTMAVAKLYEAKHTNGNADDARQAVILAQQGIMNAFDDMFASLDELEPLRVAICEYAMAFARERLAYRFGIGETAVTNVARIKAQRELFAQLAK
ncbi:hypothetical protein P9624_gp33 [Escherichia phage vB_Eco_Maverick]|uniref:Uncharacterized protein n=1 Tax=Escherichia phage vB_Eco_Maverick TaxID=2776148 RepID=A0AAD1Q637_9CAUD|nr:hypothetical protein P9624_gp33 [Escherichia phage vB_Eco_Maverick]CAD7711954.1 hypothetical protein MAVERICK_033 [Escherichia phage vB_Eco_Maverick]